MKTGKPRNKELTHGYIIVLGVFAVQVNHETQQRLPHLWQPFLATLAV